MVVGHRDDARQLDHGRCAVRIRRGSSRHLPALALLPISDVGIVDVWHTDGMRATGSNDVVIEDAFLPAHRLVRVSDIYKGTAPGAALHDADTYRWPMVPALAFLAAMPALGSAERVADIYAERLGKRVLAYEGVTQKDKPVAQAHLGEARARLRALRGLLADTIGELETIIATGDPLPRPVRAEARLAAAHIVHESRAVIGRLLEASGADQARRRRAGRPCGVRLRHQPRTRRCADIGYAGP